jgi:hypothetical protein
MHGVGKKNVWWRLQHTERRYQLLSSKPVLGVLLACTNRSVLQILCPLYTGLLARRALHGADGCRAGR